MKRTFNYTGRHKIGRKDVSIRLRQDNGVWLFDAELRLADYHLPRNGEVWIEAHRQNLWMQWSWGTVSALRVPVDRRLTEFDVPDGVLFRVRVVQPPGPEHHKLLAEADGIPFVKAGEADDRRRQPPLAPVGWRCAVLAVAMPVPEAAVDENHGLVLRQHDVRPSRQRLSVQPEPIPHPMQNAPHDLFWRRILPPDTAHVPASPFFA